MRTYLTSFMVEVGDRPADGEDSCVAVQCLSRLAAKEQ